jgi:hypothetical protein
MRSESVLDWDYHVRREEELVGLCQLAIQAPARVDSGGLFPVVLDSVLSTSDAPFGKVCAILGVSNLAKKDEAAN